MFSNMSDAVRILMVTTTLIAACYAQPTGRSRYCGTHLADALRLACGIGGYNPPAWAGKLNIKQIINSFIIVTVYPKVGFGLPH